MSVRLLDDCLYGYMLCSTHVSRRKQAVVVRPVCTSSITTDMPVCRVCTVQHKSIPGLISSFPLEDQASSQLVKRAVSRVSRLFPAVPPVLRQRPSGFSAVLAVGTLGLAGPCYPPVGISAAQPSTTARERCGAKRKKWCEGCDARAPFSWPLSKKDRPATHISSRLGRVGPVHLQLQQYSRPRLRHSCNPIHLFHPRTAAVHFSLAS